MSANALAWRQIAKQGFPFLATWPAIPELACSCEREIAGSHGELVN
jgi:hypothetical protein